MLNIYAILDKKSGVLSNHIVSADPFSRVREQMSISLLQTFLRDKTNPYVLYGNDYVLLQVGVAPDEISSDLDLKNVDHCNLGELLAASRRAYEAKNHTSPDSELDNNEE